MVVVPLASEFIVLSTVIEVSARNVIVLRKIGLRSVAVAARVQDICHNVSR
jgi:hypothetical protein